MKTLFSMRRITLALAAVLLSFSGIAGAVVPTVNWSNVFQPPDRRCKSPSALGTSAYCGTILVQAKNGSVKLNTPFFHSTRAEFTIVDTNCSDGQTLLSGTSCWAIINFTPTSVGTVVGQLRIQSQDGDSAYSVTGEGVEGPYLEVAPHSVDCGEVPGGTTQACAPITIVAREGAVTLTEMFNNYPNRFLTDLSDCYEGRVLAQDESCVVPLSYKANDITSGTYVREGELSIRSTGGNNWVRVPLRALEFAQSYHWGTSEFGACTGGTGEWALGTWAPASGCGLTTQTRVNTCVTDANSGTRSRAVTCLDGDNLPVADELCSGEPPAEEEACTPTASVCGTEPESVREFTLTDTCPAGCTPDPENNKYCLMMPL